MPHQVDSLEYNDSPFHDCMAPYQIPPPYFYRWQIYQLFVFVHRSLQSKPIFDHILTSSFINTYLGLAYHSFLDRKRFKIIRSLILYNLRPGARSKYILGRSFFVSDNFKATICYLHNRSPTPCYTSLKLSSTCSNKNENSSTALLPISRVFNRSGDIYKQRWVFFSHPSIHFVCFKMIRDVLQGHWEFFTHYGFTAFSHIVLVLK